MKRYIWILVTLLLLTSLACTALTKPAATPVGTTEPTGGTAEPTGGTTEPTGGTTEPTGEDNPTIAPPEALEELMTYRMRTQTSEKYASGETTQMQVEQSYTREPRASHIILSTNGTECEQTIEMIQIGTTQWLNMGGSWMQSAAEPVTTTFGSDIYDIFNFENENPEDYEYLGKETVNGIRTRHYRLKDNAALKIAQSETNLKDVESVNIEVWIADESKVPAILIKLVYQLKGTVEEKGPVEYMITHEVYDINADFTINPPEGASNSLAEDVPTYTGPMSNTFLMEGMASFETTDSLETVSAFYKAELPKQGWSLESDESYSGTVMQTWKKDSRSLNLMLSTADNGNTSVLITLGE